MKIRERLGCESLCRGRAELEFRLHSPNSRIPSVTDLSHFPLHPLPIPAMWTCSGFLESSWAIPPLHGWMFFFSCLEGHFLHVCMAGFSLPVSSKLGITFLWGAFPAPCPKSQHPAFITLWVGLVTSLFSILVLTRRPVPTGRTVGGRFNY